ncbi:nascent polypeptide-associated complex subunit alpha, muscle-specific form-like [Portunus trituberculatus]|uniref:nascent polypeptide-associated complex subunit alpha, muscle-specific form-like n=1 Tax=Portunus trituberculatus TaxID=210409 RepID=UPI001E1CE6F9|nr:nascent polypeptide-associated complex subunit alpha, muscle-specific form-like [Portunus trituberculatus]
MKFKVLRRPPWRRKKSPSPSRPGHAALSLEEELGGASHPVDAAAYNELVTPRRTELGLGTPDKSHIVFRASRDHVPRSHHNDVRCGASRGFAKIWRRSDPCGGAEVDAFPGQECTTWAGAGRGTDYQEGDDHCITFFDDVPQGWDENVASPCRTAVRQRAGSGGQVPREAAAHSHLPSAAQHTTCFIDPLDAACSPVCGACPGQEWAGVGEGGGAGKAARAAAGLPAQFGGDSVTRRVAQLPAAPPADSHRRSRDRHKLKSRKAVSDAPPMMRGGPRGRRAGRGSPTAAEGLPQQEAASKSTKVPGGTTLPGHATPVLTHIDYDSSRPPGGKETLMRPPPPPSPLQKSRPGRRSAALRVEGGRDGGAWSGGRRVQGSGTCGALGQPGPRTTVSARASPRAHARRSVTQNSVVRSNSTSSSGGRARVVSVSECEGTEPWPRDTAAVCEGECVCDMPCKVSGIPVYQGRGGDPPRSPREDGSPVAPLGAAAGQGRGTARRAAATRTSPSFGGISPVQMPRRGSFGGPRATAGSGGEVMLPRRASLPGPGVSAPCPGTPESPQESPRLKARTPSSAGRGPSPAPGFRAASPLPAGKASATVRRRESQRDARTPPSTPLARRPPPRAVYQVRLAAAAPGTRESPPSSRDKPSSKLPVAALKGDASPGGSRALTSRPGAARATPTPRGGREAEAGEGRGAGQASASSLKLDTPPRSLPLSLSLKSQKSGAKQVSQDLSPSNGTTSPQFQSGPRGGQRASSTPHLARSWTLQEKAATKVATSPVRVAVPRRSPSDASNHNDSRLDRSLSSSSTQINTRAGTGPKSSLMAGDAASRARIVRRVMAGGRSNLSKKKSSSKTSLTVGRQNLYNRAKSGSRSSLLGSRNNVFRASLDSQRTESTTDSGCNSPLSGSQCSLDGDRRRHGSPPSPVPRTTATDLTNKMSSALGRFSSSIHTSRPPESSTIKGLPFGAGTSIRTEGRIEKNSAAAGKSLLSAHSLNSSQLVREVTKPVVSVKRSFSLQFPSSRLSRPRLGSHEERESRLQPGINVSIRSLVPDTPPRGSEAQRNERGRVGARKEVTKVSIVAEPRTREEKGIQVETPSSASPTW